MKTLVTFYSKTGNTRFVAESIAKELGADMEPLVDKTDRGGFLGYLRSGRDAMKKKSAPIEKPKHRSREYDLIFVGTPVWGGHMTPAVRSYLQQLDFGGKKMALFCTMGSSGHEKALAEMKEMVPQAEIVGDFAVSLKKRGKEEAAKEVVEWARSFQCKMKNEHLK